MKQGELDRLNLARDFEKYYQDKVNNWSLYITEIENQCDHIMPDSESAFETGLITSECKICGYGA